MGGAVVNERKTQIVIVGGGAAGLELARRLGARYGRKHHDIILVDQHATHIWKPLLHEVATGALDANLDGVGYRGHAYRWGYRYFFGTFESIDRAARRIVIAPLLDDRGEELIGRHAIRYDYLVIAVGSVTNDFGVPGVSDHCLFLDDRDQADRFRARLLNHCLRVSRAMSADPAADARVRVAIVGAGATGVELSAELYNAAAALRHYGLETFDESRLQVTLIEAGPRILPALPEALAEAAHVELETLGVTVRVATPVVSVNDKGVRTGAGDLIEADLRVWAAGVKAPAFLAGIGGLETNSAQQIIVRPTLQSTRDARIFAIGDCCFCRAPGTDRPIPTRAQAAHQMASAAAANLGRLMDTRPLKAFVYRDHGSLVSLSRFSSVGTLMGGLIGGRLAIEGRLAKFVYASLYRQHLLAIHGWLKGAALIALGRVNTIVRPRLKLH